MSISPRSLDDSINLDKQWKEISKLPYPFIPQYIKKLDLNNPILTSREKIERLFNEMTRMLEVTETTLKGASRYTSESYKILNEAHKRLNSIPMPPLPKNYDPRRPDFAYTCAIYDRIRFGY